MKDYRFIGTAKNIAYYVISSLPQIDCVKLQNFLYCVQAVHLVRTENKEALFEDRIFAWQYGAFIPSVYQKYKKYCLDYIPCPSDIENFRIFPKKIKKKLSMFALESIDMAICYYNERSLFDLINYIHTSDPWRDVFSPWKNVEISRQSIYDYYKDMLTFYDDE